MQLATHLAFNGNCREAFEFYAKTFRGHIVAQLTWADMPNAAADTSSGNLPAGQRDRIMHARLDIGDQYLMGADTPPDRYQAPAPGAIMVCIAIDDLSQARQTFETLSARGKITMPFEETFFACGFGMCIDRFGIPWMINCAKPNGGMGRAASGS